MTLTKWAMTVAATLSVLGAGAALAHSGAKPKHGGVVQTASELTFELVGAPDGVALYVEDHGKPVAPAGMSGRLTVLNGAQKSEAELVAESDRLFASGLKLAPGTKAVAAVTTAGKKAITVRFSVK